MIKTLRSKFIWITMISVFSVLFILMTAINIINYRATDTEADNRMEFIIENRGRMPEKKGPRSYQSSQAIDDREMKEMPFSTRFFTVSFDSEGEISSANMENIAAVTAGQAESYAKELYAGNKQQGYIDDYKYCLTTIDGSDTYIFLDCSRELSSFRYFLYASLGISLLGLACVFLLVYFISSLAVKPMAESYEKQKRFITDASHEIKTPLAIIRANTDVMELEHGETEWIKSNRHQIDRLTSLTEKLVFLTRMDEDNSSLINMADFSLSDAALDTVSAYSSMAKTSGKKLSYDISPDIIFHGDQSMIRQVISLLMDNAMKYTNENGEIHATLKGGKGKSIVLTVENTVDKIKKGSHPELFDRFYRADKSRNSAKSGFGIGLSVCEAIIKAHKGTIKAESRDEKHIAFIVTL